MRRRILFLNRWGTKGGIRKGTAGRANEHTRLTLLFTLFTSLVAGCGGGSYSPPPPPQVVTVSVTPTSQNVLRGRGDTHGDHLWWRRRAIASTTAACDQTGKQGEKQCQAGVLVCSTCSPLPNAPFGPPAIEKKYPASHFSPPDRL